MTMAYKIIARVRQLAVEFLADGDENNTPAITASRELIVVQGLPELAELVRLGDTWQGFETAGVAALTALPMTVAGLSLFNGEPDTGKSYVIDSFGSAEEVVIDVEVADPKAFDRLGKAIADGIVNSDVGKMFMAAISRSPEATAIANPNGAKSDELAVAIMSVLTQPDEVDEVGLKSVSDALDSVIRNRAGASV